MRKECELEIRVLKTMLKTPNLDQSGVRHLRVSYLAALRRARVLRPAQQQVALGLLDEWHGDIDELVEAAKELA